MFASVVTEAWSTNRHRDSVISRYQDVTGGEGPSNALMPSVIGTADIATTTPVPQYLLRPVFPFRQTRFTLTVCYQLSTRR